MESFFEYCQAWGARAAHGSFNASEAGPFRLCLNGPAMAARGGDTPRICQIVLGPAGLQNDARCPSHLSVAEACVLDFVAQANEARVAGERHSSGGTDGDASQGNPTQKLSSLCPAAERVDIGRRRRGIVKTSTLIGGCIDTGVRHEDGRCNKGQDGEKGLHLGFC